MIESLSLAILVSAIIAVIFRQLENVNMYAVFKPLTTILIILLAVIIYKKFPSTYSTIMIVSLMFSLMGDIFLINKKYFLQGLSSFLLAHIGFTIGFASLFGFSWSIMPIAVLSIIGGSYFNFLRQDLHKYTIPVVIYMAAIIIMNWQAISLVFHGYAIVYIGIAVASLLFTFSDSIIAYNKFKKPFNIAEILILTTYWIAIYIFTIAGLYI